MFNGSAFAPYAYFAEVAGDFFFDEHRAEPLGTCAATAIGTFTALPFTATTAGIAAGILAPLNESWNSAPSQQALATPAIRG